MAHASSVGGYKSPVNLLKDPDPLNPSDEYEPRWYYYESEDSEPIPDYLPVPDYLVDEELERQMMALNLAEQEVNLSLYERSYAQATDEQRQQLENIVTDFMGLSCMDNYTKQILTIMGELPADTPTLTLAQVEAVCAEEEFTRSYADEDFDAWEINLVKRLNEIAGAPDWKGGSGNTIVGYFLNSDHTLVLWISIGHASYRENVDGSPKTTIARHPCYSE